MSCSNTRNKRVEFESELTFSNLFARRTANRCFGSATNFFSRGRDALYCIINDLGLPAGTGALVPAFACEEIFRPFIVAKYVLYYYRVNRDLTPDLSHINLLAKHCKVILVINYFGFNQPPQVFEKVRELGLTVIEDGAHSWLSERSGRSAGGDYYFASLRKLAPLPDGAVLINKTKECSIEYSYNHSFNWLMFIFYRFMGLLLKGSNNKRPRAIKTLLTKEAFSTAEYLLRSFLSPAPMSVLSGRILHRLDCAWIAEARRRNYSLLAEQLKSIPGCNPLFPELPPGIVPYGFPLFAENRTLLQNALENLNIQAAPLWPLSELAPRSAVVDTCLFDKTLLLPIGQDYSEKDICQWRSKFEGCCEYRHFRTRSRGCTANSGDVLQK